jgi:type IV pilus assembly protein PilW
MPLLKTPAQRGMSLVEVLVCTGLALTITLAATAAVISSRASLTSQDESSRLVESGLYALSTIERAVRQAGFEHWNGAQEHGGDSLSPSVLGLEDSSVPISSPALSGATTPGQNRSDVLALRYVGSGRGQADGSMLNCAGAGVAEPAMGDLENGRGWSIFHVARTELAEPELRCKYRSEDGLKWDSQAIATGVEAMQLLYGVDQDGDGLPERYLRAAAMADEAAWRSVVSVRVSLLLRSSQHQSDLSGSRIHSLFGTSYAAQAGQQDAGVRLEEAGFPAAERQRLRRVFSLTMALRNGGRAEPVAAGMAAAFGMAVTNAATGQAAEAEQ